MFETAKDACQYISDHNIAMVDLKVTGLIGQWLHLTIPAAHFSEKYFEEGIGYDGSSGSGFTSVEDGDVVAVPQPETAFVDPFTELPTISFLCDTATADTRVPVGSDPRTVAKRAVAYMQGKGIADKALMAPEFEFHVLDHFELINDPYHTSVLLHSDEVATDGNIPAISAKGGYMRIPPADQLSDMRSEITAILTGLGVPVHYHHHEVGAPGQCEIEVDRCDLVRAADHTMIIKYVVKNVAARHGKLATFMPKPIYGEAGNGMHVHQLLSKGGENLFFDDANGNYADLSATALQYIGGLLLHGRALTGFTNPSTNSFKRLVEGYEAPVNLFFSLANRSAAIRVPKYATKRDDKRIEYRPPDFTGNIYLSLAAMLMAGLDGIESSVDVAAHNFGPFDVDIATQDAAFRAKITSLPRSLSEAVVDLDQDRAFLTRGEVFADALLDGWIDIKRRRELSLMRSRPHPFEYQLYLDA